MNDTSNFDRHHSRRLRLDRRAFGAPLQNAAEALVAHLESLEEGRERRRRAPERARLTETMTTFIADLYMAYDDDPCLCLGYSRNKNDYVRSPRYRSDKSTHKTVTLVADYLISQGYVDYARHSYRRPENKVDQWAASGTRSRMKARVKLIAFLREEHGATIQHITTARNGELIWLRSPSKTLQDYSDTLQTKQMRSELGAINALLLDTVIEAPRWPEGINPDQTTHTLYRMFNDGRFDRGGRFYGGWWIGAKKKHRAQITINGNPTVELDYSAHHLRLCYHLLGLDAPDRKDLYALEGTEGLRMAVKWAFNVILNLKKGQRMATPDGKIKELLDGAMSVSQLRKIIEKSYPEIAEWFGRERGLDLQYIDSCISNHILLTLAYRDVPCLPIHDSYIVEKKHVNLLQSAMTQAYSQEVYRRVGHSCLPSIR